jgi:hypothetical protein
MAQTTNLARPVMRGGASLLPLSHSWMATSDRLTAQRYGAGSGAIHHIKLNDVDPQAWLADVLARLSALCSVTIPSLTVKQTPQAHRAASCASHHENSRPQIDGRITLFELFEEVECARIVLSRL